MNLLLDTHALIWFLEGDDDLSVVAKAKIECLENTNFVSIASFWEIAIKTSLKKLEMKISIFDLEKLVLGNGIQILPLTVQDALSVSQLPFHHRDPFDRILIAQAINENMAIISRDEKLQSYNVNAIW